jgi:hypothetical protein
MHLSTVPAAETFTDHSRFSRYLINLSVLIIMVPQLRFYVITDILRL